jgi:hypothetical protein
MVMRQPKPEMPMMPLGTPEPLPFKVAILWPDGPGTLSIRSFLQGQVNGVTAEITVDLSNGAHEQQLLTLFPPLVGSSLGDMWLPTPPDMTSTTDLSAPAPADLTVLPPEDLSTPTD